MEENTSISSERTLELRIRKENEIIIIFISIKFFQCKLDQTE